MASGRHYEGGRLGKNVSLRSNSTEEKFLKDGGYYKECLTKDYFRLESNPQLNKESFVFSNDSQYPYFTRTVFNNGIYGYVDYLDEAHKIKGNSLAVGMMACQFFYMSHDFYAGQFTKTAFPLFDGFNEKVALWFTTLFNKHSKKYLDVLVRDFEREFYNTPLTLPFNADGSLAIKFMESRIQELEEERVRELEEKRMRELEAYLTAAGFANCNLTPMEEEALRKFSNGQIIFKKHTIGKLFGIATGRDIIIGRTQKGQIPLISHQHNNNGITKRIAQISNRRLFNYEDTIPLADRGVFLATTQNEDFHIGTRVKALTFLDGKQTNNVRLFFVSAINQLQIMFAEYLSNATDSLPTLEIELPITSKGVVDYVFMETYISAIKKQIIQQLKDFIAKEHATYQQVIEATE